MLCVTSFPIVVEQNRVQSEYRREEKYDDVGRRKQVRFRMPNASNVGNRMTTTWEIENDFLATYSSFDTTLEDSL